ncbi:MAG: hypothetical protein GWN99_00160 [Gemmatimonadetes bacterium]|uniref:Uncharacterized protein n=1 Tax=Candidatus Kutchimonas denitrificans TaxID=3056748 RepID=A0AAE4Z4C2_9BACT|nr:hypothetical protein [Gemmatimonadota bacterium]NIR73520.1 hypothetical protein [Candidatus Kutchimonas denitrificans]NIR99479.1 hypothetical protein [Gemmatimonadota bacterium]NIT65099.1 hypothetical protein [Gemmatimonadota bacterium]NIV23632.1 hypothetical protein [Gemmatimonadota bacterium]
MKTTTPWEEEYRPKALSDMALSDDVRQQLSAAISANSSPSERIASRPSACRSAWTDWFNSCPPAHPPAKSSESSEGEEQK